METKEEILSKRIGTYGFTKLELSKPIICPIEALDAMQEYSDQNTKPLIDEIAELIKEVEYQKSGYITLKEYLKTDDILGAIAKLKSELKASKSEANEAVESQEDLLVDLLYLRNAKKVSYNDLMSQFTITRNNK